MSQKQQQLKTCIVINDTSQGKSSKVI